MVFAAFREAYEARVRDVLARWTREMQVEIARHCAGWHPDRFDFAAYFARSARRYHLAYEALVRSGAATAVDVGGFWGVRHRWGSARRTGRSAGRHPRP